MGYFMCHVADYGVSSSVCLYRKEQWTAKTYIQAPRIAELGSYLKFHQAYARILNQPLDTNALANGLFSDLILIAESPDTKVKFLESTEYYKRKQIIYLLNKIRKFG